MNCNDKDCSLMQMSYCGTSLHVAIGAGIGIKDILKIALAAGFWAEISASYSLPGELGAPIVGYTASATEPGNSCDRSELMLGPLVVERLTAKLAERGANSRPGWPLPWHCQRRSRDDFTTIPAPFRSEDDRHVIPLFGLYNYVFKKQPTAEVVKMPEQLVEPVSPNSIM